MKKHFTFLFILSLMSIYTDAQVSNGGFENWTSNDADTWVSTNGLTLLGNPQSVFKSTDAHTGNFACEINTVQVTNKPSGVFIPDFVGSIFTGKQVFITSYFGFPFAGKPTMFNFWYKYNARNNDSATIVVYTTRWNSTKLMRDTLSMGFGFIKDSVGAYTKGEINLNVFDSTHSSDTAVILFSSSTLNTKQAGAKLLLDDVAFAGGNTLITEETKNTFTIFPNPVSQKSFYITFTQAEKNAAIRITNIHGQTVFEDKLNSNSLKHYIDINGLLSGLYFISVETDNAISTKSIIIE